LRSFSFSVSRPLSVRQKFGDSQSAILARLHHMVTTALFVRLEAKPGKEAEVESFLRGGLPLVDEEPATIAWFGIRLGPTTFGIFDAFPDEAGRQAHLSGRVAAALMAKASQLFAQPPVIEKADVLAAKLPK
jgi:quinol monooxygenase YgiN